MSLCLSSVKWADEIIFLDSGSQDRSLSIAKEFTKHIYSTDWPGFGEQKNRALSYATGDWILSIDTDEYLSEELQTNIKKLLSAPADSLSDAYLIKRASYYCGQLMRFGSWRNDWCMRLFKKDTAQFTHSVIHEKLITQGTSSQLPGILYHQAYQSLEQVINKMNNYSSISANALFKAQKKSSVSKAVARGAWTFFRDYFIKLGCFDGQSGLALAISNAQGCYYRYLKLYLLNNKSTFKKKN